jgi:hypothetical protein
MIKTINLWEVRFFPQGSGFSRNLSRKSRILPYRTAQAVVRRLKKAGIDAVVGSPWRVNIEAYTEQKAFPKYVRLNQLYREG